MTHENLVTVRDGVGKDEAKALLHRHRIEKLLVVDEHGNLVGLVTVKDIEKAQLNPMAVKDAQGRLRVAAASTVGDKGYERSMALIDCGRRPAGDRHGARPFGARRRSGGAGEAREQFDAHRRRQCRDRARR